MRPSQNYIKGAKGDWEIVIGLEIHAQIASNSKLLSGASTTFGAEPNSNVSLVDAAMPGMLPVINQECVHQAIRTGLGLNAVINERSAFDRKNYFYPDLPQGYQISQLYFPIVGEGKVLVDMADGSQIEVGIERLHMEQDAGKSIHDLHPTQSYVDLNRSGVALMEIVSKPDMRSADEAKAYVGKIRSIVRALGTCDGDMEKGNLRADVNISVRPKGEQKLGTRCEIKNVNSFRFIGMAIEYEARRQVGIIEDGGEIDQETRLFDPKTGETRTMRSKEDAHDYRYFPDPDLLPLVVTADEIAKIKAELPELPDAKKARFINTYGLTPYDASVLISEVEIAEFYEIAAKGRDAKLVANWMTGELFGALNKAMLTLGQSPISPQQLGGLVALISDNTISGKIAKDVFQIMWDEGGDAASIVEAKGLKQVTDTGAIEAIVDKVISDNPQQAAAVKDKPNLFGFFVGQVMKASGGKANPQAVNDMLKAKLGM